MNMSYKGVPNCSDCQQDIRYCKGFPCLPQDFHVVLENLNLGNPPYGYCCGPVVGGLLAFDGDCTSPVWGPRNLCTLVVTVELVDNIITAFIPDYVNGEVVIKSFSAAAGQTFIQETFFHSQTGAYWELTVTEAPGVSNFMARSSSGCPACSKIDTACNPEKPGLTFFSLDENGDVKGRPSPSTAPDLAALNGLDPEAECYTFDRYLTPCSCIPSQVCVAYTVSTGCQSNTEKQTLVWNPETCSYDEVIFVINNMPSGYCTPTQITRTITADVIPNTCKIKVTISGDCMDTIEYEVPVTRRDFLDRRCGVPSSVSWSSLLGSESITFEDTPVCLSGTSSDCCGSLPSLDFNGNPMCYVPVVTLSVAGGCMTADPIELSPQNTPPAANIIDINNPGCQIKYSDPTTGHYGTCPQVDSTYCDPVSDLPVSWNAALYYVEPDCCPDPSQVVIGNYRLWIRIDGLCVGGYEAVYKASDSSTADPLSLVFDEILDSQKESANPPALGDDCLECDCCFDDLTFSITE